MLGANVGSTLIVQALFFDIGVVAPILLFRRADVSMGRRRAREVTTSPSCIPRAGTTRGS
jgi:Na+/phosphate symporter